ncbi:MAG TPA: universal stress protein [Segeticoccus sp.]|uniref:universal stress protein n=1 Tax=Segeticoccus sp. TaxID=2706531 RepID=UPI002D7FE465|nr:universal stress protein [Segeticoccus sp.]HET8600782.1 universal stress protein [Segeticoccus sp.]
MNHGAHGIVVGVDGSPSSDAALDWAVEDARRRRLPLHLVHARGLDNWWYAAGAVAPAELASDLPDELLRDRVARAKALAPELEVTGESNSDNAAPTLITLSERADTIVLGARGHGTLRGVLLGSVSMQVVAHAHCPVVVVREDHRPEREHRRIVVAVDGTAISSAAVEYAFAQAAERGTDLVAMHAWWADLSGHPHRLDSLEDQQAAYVEEQRRMVAESVAGYAEKYPQVAVHHRVVRAQPVEALVTESAAAELLVVGSRGRGGFRGLLLGSVSLRALQQAHCPVAVVRNREHADAAHRTGEATS